MTGKVILNKDQVISAIALDCCGQQFLGNFVVLKDFEFNYILDAVVLTTCASKPVQYLDDLISQGYLCVSNSSVVYLDENSFS